MSDFIKKSTIEVRDQRYQPIVDQIKKNVAGSMPAPGGDSKTTPAAVGNN